MKLLTKFKFFRENKVIEWWEEEDVVTAMDALQPDENVLRNNILYDRIQFLENQVVRLNQENMTLYLENRRLTNL